MILARGPVPFGVGCRLAPSSRTDMTPLDGVADSREETFEFKVEGPGSAVVIRATDAFGNVATTRVPLSGR